jgi:hypothetical protein
MNGGYWENLRPLEKRMVVGVGVLFFIVLNMLFVWPHFSDMNQVKFRMQVATDKLSKYRAEIQLLPTYQRKVRELEGEGLAVPLEEQSQQFQHAVDLEANESGVHLSSIGGRINTQTNQFFIEKSENISVQSGEKELVNFLFNLGSGNSLIRVRDLGIRPEPARHELVATVKLVATYQKKLLSRSGKTTPAPAAGVRANASPSPFADRANPTSKSP